MAAPGSGIVAASREIRSDLLQCGAALAAGSCRTFSFTDADGQAKRDPCGANAAQFWRTFALADRGNRAERAVARPTGTSRNATAGPGTRVLSRPVGQAVRKHRHLGDRVPAGARRREPGQGVDEGHLADEISRRP